VCIGGERNAIHSVSLGVFPMLSKFLVLSTVAATIVLPGCSESSGPSKTVRLTSSNFESMVLKSKKPVLVDFWAVWCGPCRAMDPVIKSIASEYEGRFVVGQLNVDENRDIQEQYGIDAIPAFLIFKDGALKQRVMGVVPRRTLTDVLLALQ
jgi:thioredoxin 1